MERKRPEESRPDYEDFDELVVKVPRSWFARLSAILTCRPTKDLAVVGTLIVIAYIAYLHQDDDGGVAIAVVVAAFGAIVYLAELYLDAANCKETAELPPSPGDERARPAEA